MICFIRRLPGNLSSFMKLLATDTANISTRAVTTSNHYISTSKNVQKSLEYTSKSAQRIGGLPMNLINMNISSRTFSTLQNQSIPTVVRGPVSLDESHDFRAMFPEIVRDLKEITNKYNSIETSEWFARVLEYNISNGKIIRGYLTVQIYKSLVKAQGLKPENIGLAHKLGWCIEIINAYLLILDDIEDNSITRRGQPCWYKLEDVGFTAINDALMMENAVYVLLKKYCGHTDYYVQLMELIHEITYITTCGQNLDLLYTKKSVSTFTMDMFDVSAINKTGYYSTYFPLAVAMHLAGIKDAEAFRQAKTISLEMGHFYQVQNDFFDCFGNPEKTGKIGTDIQDNKCSWLAVVCMQRANDEQKQIMLECYGKNDPEKVEKVKELYKSLDLPNAYAAYEKETYNTIKTHIQQTSLGVHREIFLHILNKFYKRDA